MTHPTPQDHRSARFGKAVGTLTFTAICCTGCSSVEVLSAAQPISEGKCAVTVYQTRGQALKHGSIEELCVINGTSSGSFSHTISTAVQKHKDKACDCGATNVFIESRSESGWNVATVTMVAFKFLSDTRK